MKKIRAFLALKFYDGDTSKKLITNLTAALKKVNIETFVAVRDIENYGKTEGLDMANFMPKYAFPEMEKSDIFIVEFSEKGVGLGMGAGFCYAKGVPVYIIAKTGSDISTTINSVAQQVIFYDTMSDITRQFKQIIDNNLLNTKNGFFTPQKLDAKKYAKDLIKALLVNDKNLIPLLTAEATNEITDTVREVFEQKTASEQTKIVSVLNKLLLTLYKKTNKLSQAETFKVKENVIYYIGRMGDNSSKKTIRACYLKEINDMNRMNLAFSACLLGDQEIELAFISKIKPGSAMDLMMRSWTLAYFKNTANPYAYTDDGQTDWEVAKAPRLERLKINDPANKKYKKAMQFRLFDLTVLFLFCKSRSFAELTQADYEIIKNCSADSPLISAQKKRLILSVKNKLLKKETL